MKSIFSPVLIGIATLCLSGQTFAVDLPDCQDTAALGSV